MRKSVFRVVTLSQQGIHHKKSPANFALSMLHAELCVSLYWDRANILIEPRKQSLTNAMASFIVKVHQLYPLLITIISSSLPNYFELSKLYSRVAKDHLAITHFIHVLV